MSRFSTQPIVRFSVDHPWIIIAISLIITVALAIPIQKLQIEPDVESLLPEELMPGPDDEHGKTEIYDKLLIMVSGENLFTVESLQQFQTTYRELQAVLQVVEIIDPFSQTTLEKTGSRLTAVPLSPGGTAPETEADLEMFKRRLKESHFAPGFISSEDGSAIVVILLVKKRDQYKNMMAEIENILKPLKKKLDVVVTGTIPFSAETESFLTEGFSRLLILVLITILLSYYLGFRSKRAVFLPITLVISGTIFSLGVMALSGFKLTMVSIISPPLVLTLGSSYSIHVMNAYYSLSGNSSKSKKDLITESVTGISGTVMLASFTTLIGLMSLMLATIRQTREFALTTSLGIFFTAILSITLLPAFLALQPVPKRRKLKILNRDPLSRILNHFGQRIVNWRFQAYAVIVIIVTAFLILLPRVSFNTSPAKYFPKSSDVIVDHNEFLKNIGGFEELKIELTGTDEGFFLNQAVLENIYKIGQRLIEIPNISYIFSFPEYLSYAGKVMTGEEGYFQSRGLNLLVSRLFGTIEMDETIANKDYSKISILVRAFNRDENMPIDENDTIALVKDIESIVENNIDNNIQWEIDGMSLNFLQLSKQMRRDFIVSTIAALFLIGFAASITFKSIIKGILALIPLLTGIFSSLILMGLFRIPLDMTTIMVSCISIGVGVDDSIHFLLQYRKQLLLTPSDSGTAVLETLKHTGRPIVITTLSIVAGLLFLSLAQFQPIRYFGLLIVFTLTTACFATLIILPPLLKSIQKEPK